ncbi:MAG: NAD-dependent epimerase/dehydratase family protein [Hyphomicrobiales bacterium]
MKVFVFGANGYIGSAVCAELRAHGHKIVAQTTRDEAASALEEAGYTPIVGKMEQPDNWLETALQCDAIIQLADSFGPDAEQVERKMLNALEAALDDAGKTMRIIYTGGCWLFGNTGDSVAAEGDALVPLKAFEYCVKHRQRLLDSDHFDAMTIHPAMVWDKNGGVLSEMIGAARAGKPVQVVNSPDTRWPMVHRDDTASLYRLVLEKGKPGAEYHAVAGNAVTVADLATAIGRRLAFRPQFDVVSENEIAKQRGNWARGYGLDQQMSAKATMKELGWKPKYADILAHLSPYGPR